MTESTPKVPTNAVMAINSAVAAMLMIAMLTGFNAFWGWANVGPVFALTAASFIGLTVASFMRKDRCLVAFGETMAPRAAKAFWISIVLGSANFALVSVLWDWFAPSPGFARFLIVTALLAALLMVRTKLIPMTFESAPPVLTPEASK